MGLYKCPVCGRKALQSSNGFNNPVVVCCGRLFPLSECEPIIEGAKNTEQQVQADSQAHSLT